MPVNIFDRFNGPGVNLSTRDPDANDVNDPNNFKLAITIWPGRVEVGDYANLKVSLTKTGGQGLADVRVNLISSDQNLAALPASVFTTSDGTSVISVVTKITGSANIYATANIGGTVKTSNIIQLSAYAYDPPENYGATGYGRIQFTIEPVFANALYPKIQRLSDAEQLRKYPYDQGLRFAMFFADVPVTFIPKDFFK